MKMIPLDRRRDVALLQQIAFALGVRCTGPAFEQLVDMIYAARRESEALKAELAEERAKRAQLQVLSEWSNDRASVQ
jgi:hypothetical protein